MRNWLLVCALMTGGCGGPTLGEVVGQEVTLTVSGLASAPDTVAIGEPRGGLGVSRAVIATSALSWLPCDEDVAELVLPARGYELLSEPPFDERITTAVDAFCGLRLDIDPVDRSAIDGVPDGSSLFVEAQGADGTPLTFRSERSFSLLFAVDPASSFGAQPLLLGFDLSSWLAGLPLPEDMQNLAAKMFDDQLPAAAALYVDANGNRRLDDDEQPALALAEP